MSAPGPSEPGERRGPEPPGPRGERPDLDSFAVDVGEIVQRTVASLYSHLVTRPTGRAVRLAIESQMAEARTRALSLVDLSEVRILDFSCADEVVAKLLLRFSGNGRGPDAFFVFRGLGEVHRGPIEAVLERQSLVAVGETREGGFELLGTATDEELRVWALMESLGRLCAKEVSRHLPRPPDRDVLRRLARRRVILELPEEGEYRALSTLIPPAGGAR